MSAEDRLTRVPLAIARSVIGVAQGAALYFLYAALEAKTWPATEPLLFAPLVLTVTLVPLIAVAGLGNLRPRTFAIWTIAATALLVGLAVYDILRDNIAPPGLATAVVVGAVAASEMVRNLPSAALWSAVLGGLFIAHSLIVSGDADRKFIASYPRYFDVAWKHGVQLILALIFLGAFWALLWLGTALFELIKVHFLTELIKKPWFAIPATVLAYTCAIHVTDLRAGIVRGARTLKLTLLSWLLPMMVLIAGAFLAALLFTGLEPLWSTRRATAVLLTAAAALVFLVNAAYQDGHSEHPVRALRYAGSLAAIALLPLVGIAAYGLALRVGQYGWTPERIIALACAVVAACYTLGYAISVLAVRPWLKWLEVTNVFTAFAILAVLLGLFSPIADPARISVADQVARLEAGKISPDAFDFAFLRFRSGRFGLEELERLKSKQDGPDAPRIAELASAALARKNLLEVRRADRITPQRRAANITVIYPKGEPLPDGFLKQDWSAVPEQYRYPTCLTANTNTRCDAMIVDLDGDGNPEIIVLGQVAAAFKQSESQWTLLGILTNAGCKGVRDALREGKFEIAAPELKELRVAGQSLRPQPGCSGG
jgi:Domain of unknown function (DUF4153)